jgi:hypothetical protein
MAAPRNDFLKAKASAAEGEAGLSVAEVLKC